MKALVTLCLLLLPIIGFTNDKYGVVDSDYILSKIEGYKEAEQKIEEFAKRFQNQIDKEYLVLKELEFEFTKDEFLFSEELKKLKKQEILNQRIKAKKIERNFFGKNGELERKRQELMRPIQNRLYEAIRTVANEGNYMMVFDVTENYGILFTNKKIDLSDDVLEVLNEK